MVLLIDFSVDNIGLFGEIFINIKDKKSKRKILRNNIHNIWQLNNALVQV